MSTVIHNRPRKHGDRLTLLQDANYFANELIRCVEQLVKIEPAPSTKPSWQQQAAALTRRVRSLARHEADEQRRRAKQRKADDG